MPEGFTYIYGSATLNPARTTGGQVISGNTLEGTNMLRILSFTLAGLYAGYDGIIASFVLNTPNQPGYYYLMPQDVIIGTPGSKANAVTGVVAGSITITSSELLMPGDANCDGSVNVIDVVTSVNFILGTNPQPFCFENADVNGDGSVNVTDVVGIIHIALENTFICGTHTISDIDGNEYNTVQVGTLCWMAENLKTTHYRNGTPVEYPGNDNEAWQTNVEGAHAWYDNDSVWKTAYGPYITGMQ